MKRLLLGIFCLSGWLTFSTCLHHEYHYVDDVKNWTDAQIYCREAFTDLVTVHNSSEMNQLVAIAPTNDTLAWIGLYHKVDWRWSLADEAYYADSGKDYRKWQTSEPGFYGGEGFCVFMSPSGRWYDYFCTFHGYFICYNGTTMDPKFIYVNEVQTWSSAQKYCRENFIDLASVRNETENQKIQVLIPSKDWAWIGMYRNPNMFWSDGSDSSFRFWDSVHNSIGNSKTLCTAADLSRSGKWKPKTCDFKMPFYCYSAPPPPTITRQIVKLKIKSDKPLDLNDNAVRADILQKLQDRLKDAGVSGVTLSWRKKTDGSFYVEVKSSEQEKEERNC
ncbi:hypothetical protein LDENG_00174020 [Lucifuga dentata]|nr:hypothetical protein LDENG_00174020 [Lucifuga dentata]